MGVRCHMAGRTIDTRGAPIRLTDRGAGKDGAVHPISDVPTPSPSATGWVKKTCLVIAAAVAAACAYVAPAGADPAQATPSSGDAIILCRSIDYVLRSNTESAKYSIDEQYEFAVNDISGTVGIVDNELDYVVTRPNVNAKNISFDTIDGLVGLTQHFNIDRLTGKFELSWRPNRNKEILYASIYGMCTWLAQAHRHFGEF